MSKATPELTKIILDELATIRKGAPFGIEDIRVFASYDKYNLDNVSGATIRAILSPYVKMVGKNVLGEGVWEKV